MTGSTDTGGPSVFDAHRRHLFGVAYRMLGSVAEAEDVVQEAWLRWSRAGGAGIDDPRAFLTTVVSRLSLDRLRSAQRRREAYVGPWLPEPLPTSGAGTTPGPEEAAELADSLTFAFLTMLDQLAPDERAVVLLHDVFGYRFREVAAMVGHTEAGCRQLASRARRRLRPEELGAGASARRPATAQVERFLLAMAAGDVAGALAELAPDVVLVSDGGPEHHAARRPVVGPDRVARLLLNLTGRMPPGAGLELRDINGDPGLIVTVDGTPFTTMAFSGGGAGGGIRRIWLVRNPDKLRHLLVAEAGGAAGHGRPEA